MSHEIRHNEQMKHRANHGIHRGLQTPSAKLCSSNVLLKNPTPSYPVPTKWIEGLCYKCWHEIIEGHWASLWKADGDGN